MKTVALIYYILMIWSPLTWSQDTLMIKKVRRHEIYRMEKEKVIDYDLRVATHESLARQLYDRHYMIYTKDDILVKSEIFSLMKPYGQAYTNMRKAQSKILALNIVKLVFSTGLLSYAIIEVPKDDPSYKECFTYIGVLVGISAIGQITIAPLRSASFKNAKTAIDLYNNGLETSSKLPKSELKFGFTTNGLGLRVNF
jgi:hypothetical protein